MRFLASVAMAASLFLAAPAFADECRAEFVENSETVNIRNLEIGVGQFARRNFGIGVRAIGGDDCSATIQIQRLDGISVVGMPAYRLSSGPTTLSITPQDATLSADNLFQVPVLPSTQQGYLVPFEITVPSEWGLKAGSFSEQLELRLLDKSGAKIDSLLLTVEINIPQTVELRFVGATGNNEIASIHIGTLSATKGARSDPFGIRVWSTSGYRVNLSSDNRGQLIHAQNLDEFPYELFFDNQRVNLGGGDEFVFPGPTPSAGAVHLMRAEASPATVRAGDYADRITVSVTAV
jgi:hypothetical protein